MSSPAHTILLLGESAGFGVLRTALAAEPDGMSVTLLPDEEAVLGEQLPEHNPDVIVIGPDLPNPLSAAGRVRTLSPLSEVVFLLPPDQLERFRAALGFVPRLGSAWTVSAEAAPRTLVTTVRDAARTATARRSSATVLGRINRQLTASARSPAAEVRHAQLVLSERYLATLLNQSPDACLAVDRDDALIAWNAAAKRVFNFDSDDVLGTAVGNLFPVQHRAEIEALVEAARREHLVSQTEIALLPVDGVATVVEIGVAPIHDDAGRVASISLTARDVTKRKRIEEELLQLNQTLAQRVEEAIAEREQAEQELRQVQKLEAVGQLTGGIAHDFNNLLQIVTGNLEILNRNLPDDAIRLRRVVDRAMMGAQRASTLTQRLLAFSRRQPLDPKPIDVNRLVRDISELLHRALGERIELETVLAMGLWPVEADPNQLESALLNLAVNARDAMPDGGKLTLETCNAVLDENYSATHAEVVPGQYVMVCVSDTGAGMDEATMAHAFEPFYTTKEPGKGTGLGLSQVYGFVKQSGGHVKIYSEPGHGSAVKIYLPRLTGQVVVEERMRQQRAPEGNCSESILVVEDDADVRAYSVEVLHELGYHVLAAADAATALPLLAGGEPIDLLFTDVVLPGRMTGADLAQAARSLRPGIKVLFTTGYARNAIIHHGRLDAGVHLVTKPFTYAGLAAKVRDVLDSTEG